MKANVRRMSCRAVLLVGTVTAVLAATAAAAQAGINVKIGQLSLSARVAISVPLTVNCSPFDPSLTFFATDAGVSVEQASGQAIAHGTGNVYGNATYGGLCCGPVTGPTTQSM
jgi:hypothetical protein